jgi:hypothetical protein
MGTTIDCSSPEWENQKLPYTQCLLKKGEEMQVAWIPSRFAYLGKTVVLKDKSKWKIEEIHTEMFDGDLIENDNIMTNILAMSKRI